MASAKLAAVTPATKAVEIDDELYTVDDDEPTVTYAGRRPTEIEARVNEWLTCSCLEPEDLPGEIVPGLWARTIVHQDIHGKPLGWQWSMQRRFAPGDKQPKNKYLYPYGKPPRIYYPFFDVDWNAWAKDVALPKIDTEGAKKAAIFTKHGLPMVGLGGCWNFRSRKHGQMLLEDFNAWTLQGATYYAIPDHDKRAKSRRDVLRSVAVKAAVLKARGVAHFYFVDLPLLGGATKTGLDDFFWWHSAEGKHPERAVEKLQELMAATPEWVDSWELNEPGNARRWVSLYGADFRHCNRSWYNYAQGVWRVDKTNATQESVKTMFEDARMDALDRGDNLAFLALANHVDARRIENVSKLAKSDPRVAIGAFDSDGQDLLVNCRNGTLELPPLQPKKPRTPVTFKFREHNPDDLLTGQTAVAWEPEAKCPLFLKALNDWTDGDKEVQRTLQQLAGLACTGISHEQIIEIMYGPGKSGKSTYAETIQAVLGTYAKSVSPDIFLRKHNGQPEERRAIQLKGARFVNSCETEFTGVIDENFVKQATGDDTMVCRELYREAEGFKPKAKILLRTNNAPSIRGTDDSIWRRVVPIPFSHAIDEKKRDKLLRQKLEAEHAGIFAWMIRGYLDYANENFYIAPKIAEAKQQYRKEQNVFDNFFEDCCQFKENLYIPRASLYRQFTDWFKEERGAQAVAPTPAQFKSDLMARPGVRDTRRTVSGSGSPQRQEKVYEGVGLLMDPKYVAESPVVVAAK